MPQLNEVVDRGINVAVTRRLGLLDGALSLLPELGINMILPSEELLYHMGWRRYQRVASQIASVGNFGRAKIRNAPATNIVVLVETVVVSCGPNVVVDTIVSNGGTLDLTTVDTGVTPRDNRQISAVGTVGSNAIVSHEANAVAFPGNGSFFRPSAAANVSAILPGAPWLLFPGSSLDVGDLTANDRFDVTFYWRERILNDQENAL